MNRDEEDTYKKAIAKYGHPEQLNMVQEECGELIAAINHYRRGRIELSALLKEIVDVQIMVEQMVLIYERNDIQEIKDQAVDALFLRVSIEKGK